MAEEKRLNGGAVTSVYYRTLVCPTKVDQFDLNLGKELYRLHLVPPSTDRIAWSLQTRRSEASGSKRTCYLEVDPRGSVGLRSKGADSAAKLRRLAWRFVFRHPDNLVKSKLVQNYENLYRYISFAVLSTRDHCASGTLFSPKFIHGRATLLATWRQERISGRKNNWGYRMRTVNKLAELARAAVFLSQAQGRLELIWF
ncbi:hypothetical protein PoB_003151600 [Plakobranchus ocellatus]|uniref:Uncharacterized protein n=1 Tax=Plakobranchus ocellatus TaxID=259542 RepID=A0AAV4AED6_9GAST|nr:hypothetical protein PoB_003151600 [Plakobranchus ocellatus]